MTYAQILNYVYSQPWAMLGSELFDLAAMLKPRVDGQTVTQAQLQARFGDGSADASTSGSVAVIPIRGCIVHRMDWWGTSCERVSAVIDQIAGDPNVKTILYDFDTPGGTVTGVQELAAKMFALRGEKKQIAIMNGMAASAGYYLAAQCDERVCIPTGCAGSIGVLWPPHFDLSGSLEQDGIKVTVISSGKFKTEWNPFEPPSEEAKAIKQAQSDAFYGQFLKDVARGLGVTAAAVKSGYGEGRVLFAKEAKEAGLIDRIATMDDTIARLVGRSSPGGVRALSDADLALAEALKKDMLASLTAMDDAAQVEEQEERRLLGEADRVRRLRLL